jgi:hypothetical protein
MDGIAAPSRSAKEWPSIAESCGIFLRCSRCARGERILRTKEHVNNFLQYLPDRAHHLLISADHFPIHKVGELRTWLGNLGTTVRAQGFASSPQSVALCLRQLSGEANVATPYLDPVGTSESGLFRAVPCLASKGVSYPRFETPREYNDPVVIVL